MSEVIERMDREMRKGEMLYKMCRYVYGAARVHFCGVEGDEIGGLQDVWPGLRIASE